MTLYEMINEDLAMCPPFWRKWVDLDDTQRACNVMLWCVRHGVDTFSLHDAYLGEAMSKQPTDMQQPADYLRAVNLLVDYMRARG